MSRPRSARLVLDEMFSPTIAATLRERRHDVVAVAERVDLRSVTDEEVFAWAVADNRWLLTENVKDFRPVLLRAMQAGRVVTGLLLTSSRSFPRSRQNPGPLVGALHAWLSAGPPASSLTEDWLLGRTRSRREVRHRRESTSDGAHRAGGEPAARRCPGQREQCEQCEVVD